MTVLLCPPYERHDMMYSSDGAICIACGKMWYWNIAGELEELETDANPRNIDKDKVAEEKAEEQREK